MDKFDITAAVLGKGDDFVLIPLPADERSTLALEYAAAHGLAYCDVMGFIQELLEAARECHCSPKIFAAQSVESVLASRRLPKVTPGSIGPRVVDDKK